MKTNQTEPITSPAEESNPNETPDFRAASTSNEAPDYIVASTSNETSIYNESSSLQESAAMSDSAESGERSNSQCEAATCKSAAFDLESQIQAASPAPTFTQEEVTRLVDEAYLRGRNEAIKAKILEESATRIDHAAADTPGLDTIFTFRDRVW